MRSWLLTAALLGLAVLALELLSRVAIGHPPRTRIDPQYGTLTIPDEPVVQSKEGFSRSRTNELGHLDGPMPVPPPADGILVIGDSFTEARQVAREDRFTDRLAALLGRRVYNVGHEGWSPINALGFVRAERERFHPSQVIVQVSGNDVTDIVTAGGPHVIETAGVFSIVIPSGEKHGLARKITAARETVSRSAAVSNVIATAMSLWRGTGGGESLGMRGATAYCKPPNELSERALPWLIGELAHAHPDVRLLYVPQLDYHAGCVDRCVEAKAHLARAAAAAGIEMIDVTAPVCEAYRRTGQPLNGFANSIPGTGHFNTAGHIVIAKELAAHL